jgi:hypothetical protein
MRSVGEKRTGDAAMFMVDLNIELDETGAGRATCV